MRLAGRLSLSLSITCERCGAVVADPVDGLHRSLVTDRPDVIRVEHPFACGLCGHTVARVQLHHGFASDETG